MGGKIPAELLTSQAAQDQEIAAAAKWFGDMNDSDQQALLDFFGAINDGEPADFRKFDDPYLHVVRAFALIGFFEALHAYDRAAS